MRYDKSRITSLLSIFGVPRPAIQPRNFLTGPFVFNANLVDNATTVTNLTTTAAIVDPALKEILDATTDQPEIVLLISGVRARIETSGNDEGTVMDAFNQSRLKWSSGGFTRIIALAPYMEGVSQSAALDNQAAAAAEYETRPAYMQARFNLDVPLMVSFRDNTFEYGPQVAVDTDSGDLQVQLFFEGAAWKFGEEVDVTDLNCQMKGGKVPPQVLDWMVTNNSRGLRTMRTAAGMAQSAKQLAATALRRGPRK